ncbi:MAG: hypothetical protein KJN71_10165, partial [Acidimicrobiia bacterium]|nr:hypothetical protein [Acidimicrobiia bacterium]
LWGNDAGSSFGGAIYVDLGSVDVTSSLIGPANTADQGGGIYVDSDFGDGGILTMTDSAVVHNSASDEGGGVFNLGSATLTNVTISGNDAGTFGGGYNENAFSTTNLTDVTITANTAGVQAGGLRNTGVVNPASTIIAGNFAPAAPDCDGLASNLGNNLIGTTGNATTSGCGFSDGINNTIVGSDPSPVDPLLGSLETAVINFNFGAVDLEVPYSETFSVPEGDYVFKFTVQPTGEGEEVTVTLGALYSDTITTDSEGDPVSIAVPIEVETSGDIDLDMFDNLGGSESSAVSDLLLIRLDGPASVHPLLAGSPAIDAGAPLDTVNFPTFTATPAPLTFNGASIVNDGSQDVLRTNAPAFVAGSAFLTDPIPVDESWSTEFDFRIVPQTLFAGESGDGIAFAVAPSNTFLGDPAGRLGIGVTSSTSTVTAVGFKTYGTPGNVGIYVNPTSDSSSVFPTVSTTPGDLLDDGQVRTVWIDYDALSTTLEVRMAAVGSPRPSTALLSYPVDIAASLGTTNAYLGFTGSSGAATALQDVLRWELATSLDCSGEDQRGIDREPYGPCDIGAYELEAGALNPSVSLLDFSSDNPTPSPGASSISVADIPRDVIVGASGPGASSTPISDIESASVDSAALNSTALNSVALNSTALNSTALNSTDLDDNALDAVLLSDVPITGGWDDILAVSVPPVDPALAGLPIQTVTLLDALSDPAISAELAARGITIADLDLGDTPLGSLPFSAIAMGTISIKDIGSGDFPRGSGGDPSGVGDAQVNNLVAWCDELTQAVCAQLGVTFDGGGLPISTSADGISLMTLVLAGSPVNSAALNSTALNSVALNSTALNSTPISAAALNSTALNSTALNSVALNSTALNSVALNSTALNSTALNSTALNSVALNSVALNSTALNSVALNSTALNSTALNSTALNSVALNSVALNSTALNSVALNSTALNSTALNSTALNSV